MISLLMAQGAIGPTSTGTAGISITIPPKPAPTPTGEEGETAFNRKVKYTAPGGAVVYVLEPKARP